jgi:hypothetical protein
LSIRPAVSAEIVAVAGIFVTCHKGQSTFGGCREAS